MSTPTMVQTRRGDMRPAEIVAEVLAGLPLCAKPGWTRPAADIPWLAELVARHERTVATIEPAAQQVPGALVEVTNARAGLARAMHEHRRAEVRALWDHTTLPPCPQALVNPRAPLDTVWAGVEEACNQTAVVIAEIAATIGARWDEVWRSHVAHTRNIEGYLLTSSPSGSFWEMVEPGSMNLPVSLNHLRELPAKCRAEVDPKWTRDEGRQ